jgi:hypothetical protein
MDRTTAVPLERDEHMAAAGVVGETAVPVVLVPLV